MNKLQQREDLPAGFLDADHRQMKNLLGSPCLIHLPGENTRPLFVSTLLHGNEDTGLVALQCLLKKYQHQKLPRAMSIFIGNVDAAVADVRHLDGQPDYNRVWPGSEEEPSVESELMQQVVDEMKKRQPFASIDLHNNTGRNPHYGCVNRLQAQYLQLARLFSHTVVFFTSPKGVQSQAFAPLCPAVTLECGKVGEMDGIEHACRFLETTLQLEHLPAHTPTDIDLLHTVARITIDDDVEFSFEGSGDISLNGGIELYNFRAMEAGTVFGAFNTPEHRGFHVWDDDGNDVFEHYFDVQQNNIVLKKVMMPSMFTKNIEVIRQDCLCYLMEHLPEQDSAV